MYGDTAYVDTLAQAVSRARADYEKAVAAGGTDQWDARMRMWAAEDAHRNADIIRDLTAGAGRDNEADLPWSEKANAFIIGEKAMQAAEQETAGFHELIDDAQSAGWEDVVEMEEVEPGVYAVDQDEAGL
jgi:hypothetical protein